MIQFFNIDDDKYFYLDSVEYGDKKMFLSEIEVVEFHSSVQNDYFSVTLFAKKGGTADLEPCGYIVCCSEEELCLIEMQFQAAKPTFIKAFIGGDRALINFSVFENMTIYGYQTVRDITDEPLVFIKGQPITAVETMDGKLSRSPVFNMYIRAVDFPKIAFTTLMNSGDLETSVFKKYLYDIKLAAEVYRIFSESDEADGIDLFLEMKKGGLL